MAPLRVALRENDVLRHVVLGAVVFVGIAALSGRSVLSLAPAFGVAVGWELFDVAADVYGFPDGTRPISIGLVLTGISAYWLVAKTGVAWLPTVALAFGVWLVGDGYKTYRDGPVTRPRGPYFEGMENQTGEAMYRMQTVGRVARAVKDTPRTAETLADDLGLTVPHTRDILDTLEVRGIVHEEDDVYRPNPDRFTKTSLVVRFLKWLPRRLLRPVR